MSIPNYIHILFLTILYYRTPQFKETYGGASISQVPISLEEPITKRYKASLEGVPPAAEQGERERDVYYCMNVVIQSRAFEMKQEIIEGMEIQICGILLYQFSVDLRGTILRYSIKVAFKFATTLEPFCLSQSVGNMMGK